MVTREDLESFLIRMGGGFEEVDEGMYLLEGMDGGPKVVVHHSPPVLLVRLKVMDLPEHVNGATDLFRNQSGHTNRHPSTCLFRAPTATQAEM